jgi:hypothetical protein
MNAASTPYAGRLRGWAAGLMRPAGQAVLSWPRQPRARTAGRQDGRLGAGPRPEQADDPPDPSLSSAVERQ